MLTETILDQIPVWLLYGVTVVLLFGGSEFGFRLGKWLRSGKSDSEKASANAIMGSTLGLLAFMLAFTFGMSSTRFEARKQLVLEEASAALVSYQRAQLLPEPEKQECSRLLRDYVGVRIHIAGLKNMEELQEALTRSEHIQDALWAQAENLSDRPSAILGGFMQSLSALTDLQMKRVRAAVWNRIPTLIVITLFSIAFLALTAMGYSAALAESRATIPAVLLILAFSAIIVLIVDLERPRQQLFHISQEPMIDVSRRIQSP